MSFSGRTRFKPDAVSNYGEFIAAARSYMSNLTDFERRGLYENPLDWHPGHPSYLTVMYQLLNAVQMLKLQSGSVIVEVGSGAGWATEILASLRYRVECVEPSAEMIEVAKERVHDHLRHHRASELAGNVRWQCATMEDCVLADGEAHAVMFFESFHHVVDERAALNKIWHALRPGGQLIILGDSNWIPGHAEQEALWAAEMEAFGTLESPLTHDYMVWLLEDRGFIGVTRHHAVNTFVPISREHEPVRNFAHLEATYLNLVLARKPIPGERAEAEPTPAAAPHRPPRTIVGRVWRALAKEFG